MDKIEIDETVQAIKCRLTAIEQMQDTLKRFTKLQEIFESGNGLNIGPYTSCLTVYDPIAGRMIATLRAKIEKQLKAELANKV